MAKKKQPDDWVRINDLAAQLLVREAEQIIAALNIIYQPEDGDPMKQEMGRWLRRYREVTTKR